MKCKRMVDVGRRQFLRGGAIGIAGAATSAFAPTQARAQTASARVEYPSNRLANLTDLMVDEPMDVAYPDDDSPGILLKLGKAVEGGAGPDGDIVAYSVICPHRGFYMNYDATDRVLNCPGHYSRFDVEKGGLQIWGQATQNLPQFTLRVDDDGEIYAEGVDELLYGRTSNVL